MKQPILLLLLLVICSCGNNNNHQSPTTKVDSDTITKPLAKESKLTTQDSIQAVARQVLVLLKSKDYSALIKYFSNEGVSFSPYGFIDTAKNKKLTADDFLEAIQKKWILTWGSFDGTGEPIKLTTPDYLEKFVYNADYLNAEAVGYDKVIQEGNSRNNLHAIYPNDHFVDYYFSGFKQEVNGLDWTSLRLVFRKENNDFFLVAVIHDQWTI